MLQTIGLQRAAQPFLFLRHACYFELVSPCLEHYNPCFKHFFGSVHLLLHECCTLHIAVGSIIEQSVVPAVQRMLEDLPARIMSTVWAMHIVAPAAVNLHGRMTLFCGGVFLPH